MPSAVCIHYLITLTKKEVGYVVHSSHHHVSVRRIADEYFILLLEEEKHSKSNFPRTADLKRILQTPAASLFRTA